MGLTVQNEAAFVRVAGAPHFPCSPRGGEAVEVAVLDLRIFLRKIKVALYRALPGSRLASLFAFRPFRDPIYMEIMPGTHLLVGDLLNFII